MVSSFAFILGCWQAAVGPSGSASLIEEYHQVAPGLIEGVSRTVENGRSLSREDILIEGSESWATLTSTFDEEGRPARFRLVEADAKHAVFQTMDDDLPFRISYERKAPGQLVVSLYSRDNLVQPAHSIGFHPCAELGELSP